MNTAEGRGGLVEDILALARIPAPSFEEEARIAWIERRLEGRPGIRRRDRVGNLIWQWGEGRPRVLVTAHVDTVFPLGTDLSVQTEDGCLIGPGVGDNAAAVAAAIVVVEEMLRHTAGPGALVFTVGEEGLGNLRGARAVLADLRPEAAIALEGHGLEHVVVDAVGSLRARILVQGPGGHPWVEHGLPSAIHALITVADRLLTAASDDAPLNIGTIEGGRSVNSIAEDASLLLELRSLEETHLDGFRNELTTLAVTPPLYLTVEEIGIRPGGRLDRSTPLLALVQHVRRALGLPDALGTGSTDANAAFPLGIPALTLGITFGSGMHTTAERIQIEPLTIGCAQLRGVLQRLLA